MAYCESTYIGHYFTYISERLEEIRDTSLKRDFNPTQTEGVYMSYSRHAALKGIQRQHILMSSIFKSDECDWVRDIFFK